ncbi:hypothetical protein BN137_3417 [Cronobacter condimenti 1330]|uniref:Uncharacterized protein n=1 Tax=Cronobacter condimenti 1330 TaxID=1073999 RepID=K8AE11_9ENTR|nr:hypothetical protein BN137_3417 [Cronobacter condimenti 1330]
MSAKMKKGSFGCLFIGVVNVGWRFAALPTHNIPPVEKL